MPPGAIPIFSSPQTLKIAAVTDTQAITIPEPTTLPQKINDLYLRPLNSDKLHSGSWGVAAPAKSAQFKKAKTGAGLPLAKRWDDRLTPESVARKGSTLKGAAKFLAKPGLISLGGGLPSSQYFPFEGLAIDVPAVPGTFQNASQTQNPMTQAPTNEAPPQAKILLSGKHDLAEGSCIFDISTAFNYGQGSGSAQLLRWVTEHTEFVHSPPYADWACNLTIGSTSAFDMALRMLCRRGETLLAENHTFPTAIETTAPMGIKMVGVDVDEEGMIPEALDKLLSEWDSEKRGLPKPRVMYTVPTGQNPTGATMGTERRKAIYKLCQKHDIFILEDEPYYFLQMPEYGSTAEQTPTSRESFLKSLIPSLLSMDVDGRVLRMDSFSKVIAPGSRVGWVTASEQIIERYKTHVDCSTQGPSGISQLVLFKLLDKHWGHGGYIDWLRYIRQEYTARRDNIVSASEKHLPREVVSWTPPRAGMFHWLKVDWSKHPLADSWTFDEIEEQIFMASIDHGALVTRGSWFVADNEAPQKDMFFRATYAAAPAEQIDLAIQRFGDAIREVFHLKETNRINGVNGH